MTLGAPDPGLQFPSAQAAWPMVPADENCGPVNMWSAQDRHPFSRRKPPGFATTAANQQWLLPLKENVTIWSHAWRKPPLCLLQSCRSAFLSL